MKCFSCGKSLKDKDGNTCRGCGHVVCVECVDKYGHFWNGAHGKKKKNNLNTRNKSAK